jgi:hypothetical protein
MTATTPTFFSQGRYSKKTPHAEVRPIVANTPHRIPRYPHQLSVFGYMVSIDILPGVNQFFFTRYPSLGIQVGGVSILPLSNRFLFSHAKSSLH